MKIIIFDGSFKTTPFINRLAKGLVQDHQVYVLGFNERLNKPIAAVEYVALGSNQNKMRLIKTTVKKIVLTKKWNLFFSTLKDLMTGKKRDLQQQNLNIEIQRINPDVIHLQWPALLPWVENILLKQTPPVLLSQRGFHNLVRPSIDKSNASYLKTWFPKVKGFHSVSQAISTQSNHIWTAPNKLDQVIYTGLPMQKIYFDSSYTKQPYLQLLSVGRPHWVKGYDYALQACKLLKEQGVDFQYTIIGGKGDEELNYMIHELKLQDQITLHDRMSQTDVYTHMKQASILIVSSVEEGLPNVIVEAMAVGLPVISTNCGGVSEVIEHGVNGWLIPIRNPTAMAEEIINVSNLPENEIETIRIAARKKVEKQHNEAQMIDGMISLYKAILEKPMESMDRKE